MIERVLSGFQKKKKYYKPLLLIENSWLENINLDQDKNFSDWQNYHLIRAKTYELFKYYCKFASDDFANISKFIRDNYNILEYHDPNKIWTHEKNNKIQVNKELVGNVITVNDALFWKSDSRIPHEL